MSRHTVVYRRAGTTAFAVRAKCMGCTWVAVRASEYTAKAEGQQHTEENRDE